MGLYCGKNEKVRGIYRGVEEGTTYYQYTTMGVENLEETVMPYTLMQVSRVIEENDYLAIPQRRHQTIMSEENSTNPEVDYTDIFRGVTEENQLDFLDCAVKCGLGERSMIGSLLNKEFGPFVRYCFVLTDAEIEPTELEAPSLCDRCGECLEACPGKAISEDGNIDPWRCAVYYNGANGTKNPFMPPDAFYDLDNRLEIIDGSAKFDTDGAKEILDNIYFYPPAQHAYQCSICGRSCDVACYIRLEEKGLLSKKFKTPFRKRSKWYFPISEFEQEKK